MKIQPFVRQNVLLGIFLSSFLFFSSCKKEVNEQPELPKPTVQHEFSSTGGITLTWNKVGDNAKHMLDIRTKKMAENSGLALPGNSTNETTLSFPVGALCPSTAYMGRLGSSVVGYKYSVVTFEFTSPCFPIPRVIVYPSKNGALVEWLGGKGMPKEALSDIPSFTVYVRQKGIAAFETIVTTSHFVELNNLLSGNYYQVKVTYMCSNDNKMYESEWSDFYTQ